jgi:2-oxo-4-hydroxy-4-carboxy--5-ureidoimidazoline (OHCU) decarboxylase
MPLAPLTTIQSSAPALAEALSTLFEPSPVITSIAPLLAASPSPIAGYPELIDLALVHIRSLPHTEQAKFIAGHPRIGETKNLSALSAKEQGLRATPPEVLRELERLNALYEARYPGLRYITFVNGRSRAEVAAEMADVLDGGDAMMHEAGSDGWLKELERAVKDVGLIAQSRLL